MTEQRHICDACGTRVDADGSSWRSRSGLPLRRCRSTWRLAARHSTFVRVVGMARRIGSRAGRRSGDSLATNCPRLQSRCPRRDFLNECTLQSCDGNGRKSPGRPAVCRRIASRYACSMTPVKSLSTTTRVHAISAFRADSVDAKSLSVNINLLSRGLSILDLCIRRRNGFIDYLASPGHGTRAGELSHYRVALRTAICGHHCVAGLDCPGPIGSCRDSS